jgi:hypothetical protein
METPAIGMSRDIPREQSVVGRHPCYRQKSSIHCELVLVDRMILPTKSTHFSLDDRMRLGYGIPAIMSLDRFESWTTYLTQPRDEYWRRPAQKRCVNGRYMLRSRFKIHEFYDTVIFGVALAC